MAVMQSRLRELKKRFCLIATINSTQQILHMSGETSCPKGQGKRVCVKRELPYRLALSMFHYALRFHYHGRFGCERKQMPNIH